MGAHIVVCSKNPVLLDAATRAFEPGRFRLTVCESGLEDLGTVKVVYADLLILDMQTPGLNSLLMIAAARQRAPRPPILEVGVKPHAAAGPGSQRGVSYTS